MAEMKSCLEIAALIFGLVGGLGRLNELQKCASFEESVGGQVDFTTIRHGVDAKTCGARANTAEGINCPWCALGLVEVIPISTEAFPMDIRLFSVANEGLPNFDFDFGDTASHAIWAKGGSEFATTCLHRFNVELAFQGFLF
jgi:hypothetical protein